ncbi:hypothetical protein AS890_06720 [Rhizobium anhuiense bv. trifolii]|nr:hypothetical protein AS890_06720 [Rhizobium anhuiense bv. trifolii]
MIKGVTRAVAAERQQVTAIRVANVPTDEFKRQKGGDQSSSEYQSAGADTLISRKDAAEQAGISRHQQVQAIRVRNLSAGQRAMLKPEGEQGKRTDLSSKDEK